MKSYEQNTYNKVKRGAKRAAYDYVTVHQILDDAFLCHIAYVWEGRTIVIPTAYGRDGETIYVHGAVANRMIKALIEAKQASMTVTHLDGMVLARSAFHHSANYRSVAVFGKVTKLEEAPDKLRGLKVIMDHMLPGRWDECRQPTDQELKGTLVAAIEIEFASAKVRSGGPIDDEEDYDSPYWAGEIPMTLVSHPAISDELLRKPIPIPDSVTDYINKRLMLELRPNCENCDKNLPPESTEACICTFECTFCTTCVEKVLNQVCPNCGGEFVPRPIRPTELLKKYPASTKRVLKSGS